MKAWKVWVGLILVFSFGMAIGSMGTGLIVKYKIAQVIKGGSPVMTRAVMRRLSCELRLTGAQKADVEKTVVRVQNELHQVRMKYRPETESIIQGGLQEIRLGLTEDQQKRLDDMRAQLKSRWDLPTQ